MRNLKKVISSVAALAIVASSASAFAASFPDVDASASYANAVETLTALGVINGDDNGLFNPDNQVTRAEFTKMAVEALGEGDAATAQTTSQFADAANTTVHWAAGYIAQGVSDGFINGYDDTTFGPNDQVTYAQACKMLVAAIGYTTYAENQGGYPSGYVAQASTLGITSGVSATNDTNLTRAQVATLIYNTLDVPLCVIDSWESTSTLTGVVQTPVLKKMDGKENRDYETLLTDRHDAYKVKGRVMETSVGADGLDKDEVKYKVEVADNFDDIMNITKGTESYEMHVGNTDAASMLFEYTEAIIQKDDDADEYTILSITQYGSSKIVEFAADDLADDDSAIGTAYINAAKLPVYKNSTSSSTTKYDLSLDENKTVDAVIYVNGVEVGTATDALIDQYILQNATGTVKLVDVTETGSTSTDGKYEYIMISYYVDAIVDSVQTTSTYARVYFKGSDNAGSSMKWDPDDEDIDITFTKDGSEIAYTDLAEYDVLSIAVNVNDAATSTGKLDLNDLEYYDILVSSNQVSGTLSSRDTTDYTVRFDGQDYDVVENLVAIGDMELSTEYTLYIDAFGYVAYYDEGNSEKNYGVIVAMYTSAGNDYPTVRLITSNAEVVAYECKDNTEAAKFANYATAGLENEGSQTFTKSQIAANIKAGKTVCTYKLSAGKLKFDKAYVGVGDEGLEFKASSSKLGSYTIADGTTKIIDMDNYMSESNSGSTVGTLSVSSFEDEAEYDAYLFDKNSNGDYRFAIVFKGTSSIRPETEIAVVTQVVGTTDVDGTTCSQILVAKGGQEGIEVLVEGEDAAAEGDVIAYVVSSDGYVEDGDLYTLISADSSYDTMLANTLANDDFGKSLNADVVNLTATSRGKAVYEIAYEGPSATKDVYVYYGPVYKKQNNSLELFTSKAEGVSNINDVESLSIAGANTYVYDFGQKAKYRVSVGSATQSNTIFNQAYTDDDKNIIAWDTVVANDTNPALALVKEVDGDVTDVIFYVAP
ncbi:MAG: S-layer homology domain-containing protein [Candidatus Ornithomonoglobus sp.]